MCKVYNTIGSLTTIYQHLDRHNILDFKSLEDIIHFHNSYSTYRQEIVFKHKFLIEQESISLQSDLQQLNTLIESQKLQVERELNDEIDKLKKELNSSSALSPTNYFQNIIKRFKQWYYKKKIHNRESNLSFQINNALKKLTGLYQVKNNRYQYILSHFDDAVKQSYRQQLTELERKKSIIDELSSFIYGALGEQKVVKTLEALSDEYFLINDFAISLSTPIYNRQENDYIKSIQIDHILVAPSGIFLIETKNWSKNSLENVSLRSPVQQIKRTSFVLFKLLNNEISSYHLNLDKHHWGDKKLSIRNLIVLTNTKPKEEFQYVKILTLSELPGYIKYFKPIFSYAETQRITDLLLNINNKKTIATSRNEKFYYIHNIS